MAQKGGNGQEKAKSKAVCQYCDKPGHTAKECRTRLNSHRQEQTQPGPKPDKQAPNRMANRYGSKGENTHPGQGGPPQRKPKYKTVLWMRKCFEKLGLSEETRVCFRCLRPDCDFKNCRYITEGPIKDDWKPCSKCKGGLHITCQTSRSNSNRSTGKLLRPMDFEKHDQGN